MHMRRLSREDIPVVMGRLGRFSRKTSWEGPGKALGRSGKKGSSAEWYYCTWLSYI